MDGLMIYYSVVFGGGSILIFIVFWCLDQRAIRREREARARGEGPETKSGREG